MRRLVTSIAIAALLGLASSDARAQGPPAPAAVPARPDATLAAIRRASQADSRVAATVGHLADVVGPRMLGTPAYHRAAMWAAEVLRAAGADSVSLESFDEGPPGDPRNYRGWEAMAFGVELLGASSRPLHAHPQAFTSATPGTVTGEAVLVASDAAARELAGQLRGKVLLLSEHYRTAAAPVEPVTRRYTAEELRRAAENPDPNDLMLGYHSRRSTADGVAQQEARRRERAAFFRFVRDEGVLALVEPSDVAGGLLHADGNGQVPSYIRRGDAAPVASFVLAHEHFGHLVRIIGRGERPQLRLRLDARFHDDPRAHVNVLAEWRGRDPKLAREVVILGAHLDSWHAGTGAADNAAGVAIMMEAARLLHASGLRPRRTVRVALWGGEEQIFAGSRAYVARHVGDLTTGALQPGHGQISAYLNLDNGAGRIRGVYAMGNPGAAAVWREVLAPFPGDNTVTLQNANQTDHELFDALNIPAFQFIQDPLGYIPTTHHTNLDVLDHVPVADLRASAELVAYAAWQLAERDGLMPRKPYVSIQPSRTGRVAFRLAGREDARAVHLVGDFNNWGMFGTPLARVPGGWECHLDLPPGRYVYKFIVDGNWTNDPSTPAEQLVRDGKGHAGLTVRVVD